MNYIQIPDLWTKYFSFLTTLYYASVTHHEMYLILQNISDEKFDTLFEALSNNTHLETLSLTNVGLTDRTAMNLADALEKNNTLRVVNVETNFISPAGIVRLIKSLLKTKSVEEFRASNQVGINNLAAQKPLNYHRHVVFLCRDLKFSATRSRWK